MLLLHAAASAALAALLFSQSVDGVSVSTDATTYAPGDAIQVTIFNAGPDRIQRGGLDCDDVWPLSLEQRQDDATWQAVPVLRHQCIGIAAAIVAPGETQTRTISLTLDPGTYHVVYAFEDVDDGSRQVAASDPFDVLPAS